MTDVAANALARRRRGPPPRDQAELVEVLTAPERRLLALAVGPGKNDLLAVENLGLGVGDYEAALHEQSWRWREYFDDAKALTVSLTDSSSAPKPQGTCPQSC